MWTVDKGMEWEFCSKAGPRCPKLVSNNVDAKCLGKHHGYHLTYHPPEPDGIDSGAPASTEVDSRSTDDANGPQISDVTHAEWSETDVWCGAKGAVMYGTVVWDKVTCVECLALRAGGQPVTRETNPPTEDWRAEGTDLLVRFLTELQKATGDGSKKRQAGTKPPWYRDDEHEGAIFSHLTKWKRGELVDPDSGAHPLVHAAWRCLAIACRESGNTPT